MPIIPATWEAEAGESLEPGRQKLQSAKIAPLHSSLGNIVRLFQKKSFIYLFILEMWGLTMLPCREYRIKPVLKIHN